MSDYVWVVTGKSESGDDCGPVAYGHEPTEAQLKKLALSWDGNEDEDGPGDYGSYVYMDVDCVKVEMSGGSK